MSDKAIKGIHASANELDARLRRVDETRWIATRYAPEEQRRRLVALYLFNHELSRAAHVSEPMIASIRLQWWREALTAVIVENRPTRHELLPDLARVMALGAGVRAGLFRLLDSWEDWLDNPERQGPGVDGCLAAVAVTCVDPQAGEASIANVSALAQDPTQPDRREHVRKIDSQFWPVILHLAARDRRREPTAGLQARWQILRAMLLRVL